MSSKRVRFITLAGVLFVVLLIGISLLVAKLSLETRLISLPEMPDGVTDDGSQSGEAAAEAGLASVEVTTGTVQAVIATLKMKRPVSYSRQIRVTNYYSDGSAVYTIKVYVLEDAKSMRITGTGQTKNIIIADGMLYVWEDGDTNYYKAVQGAYENENKLSDMYQMILTYEDVLEIDPSGITYAGYEQFDDEMCIVVRYTTEQFQYLTTCYISVESGLLVGVEQYDGNTLVYTMTASDFSAEYPDGAQFDLPDGENPLAGI